MNTSHKTFMAACLFSLLLSSTALAQSSGIAWKNGNVLTAQQMQQLDNAKMNVDSLGKPGFAPKLNDAGQITNPVVGSVANAPANAAGDTVSSIADIAKSAQITANEAIPAAQADGRYVHNNAGTDGGIVALDIASGGSGNAAFERKDGRWGMLQPAGDYVTGLASGKIMQDFTVSVSGSGVHDITFPRAFSSTPTTIVISHGLTDGSNSPVSVLSGWTSKGFKVQTSGSTTINFLAVGPS